MFDQFVHLAIWQYARRLVTEFVAELRICHGFVDVSQRLFDELFDRRAIGQFDFDIGLIFGDCGIGNRSGAFTDAFDLGVGNGFVRIFRQPGFSPDQRDSRSVVYGKICLRDPR